MRLGELLDDCLSVVMPHECNLCGRVSFFRDRYFCPACNASLPRSGIENRRDNPMEAALFEVESHGRSTAYLSYRPATGTAFLLERIKYTGVRGLARYMGRRMAIDLLKDGFFSNIDTILPIPLHYKKFIARGFNQSEEIALGVSDVTGIPVGDNLVALRAHSTQTRKSHAERTKNVAGVFGVRRSAELEGKSVLIMDDVFTTGATILSAAKAIKEACSPADIRALTLAIASSD